MRGEPPGVVKLHASEQCNQVSPQRTAKHGPVQHADAPSDARAGLQGADARNEGNHSEQSQRCQRVHRRPSRARCGSLSLRHEQLLALLRRLYCEVWAAAALARCGGASLVPAGVVQSSSALSPAVPFCPFCPHPIWVFGARPRRDGAWHMAVRRSSWRRASGCGEPAHAHSCYAAPCRGLSTSRAAGGAGRPVPRVEAAGRACEGGCIPYSRHIRAGRTDPGKEPGVQAPTGARGHPPTRAHVRPH